MTKAEKTRQYIVEKTAPIFNVKGYAGTSLTDMTEATGLTKGSIYGNFANKDEVALAAFDHNLNGVQKLINHEISKQTTMKEKLLVYVTIYENFLKYPFPEGGCPILNTAIEADDTHAVLRKKAAGAIVTWKNGIMALIKKGVAAKEFKADANAEQVALTIIAMIEGGIMIAKVTGKEAYRKQVVRSVEQMIQGL